MIDRCSPYMDMRSFLHASLQKSVEEFFPLVCNDAVLTRHFSGYKDGNCVVISRVCERHETRAKFEVWFGLFWENCRVGGIKISTGGVLYSHKSARNASEEPDVF